jgi:hypothetical protein
MWPGLLPLARHYNSRKSNRMEFSSYNPIPARQRMLSNIEPFRKEISGGEIEGYGSNRSKVCPESDRRVQPLPTFKTLKIGARLPTDEAIFKTSNSPTLVIPLP